MTSLNWVRTLRTIVIAAVLVAALLAALLGMIGAAGPAGMWAHDMDGRSAMPPPSPGALAPA
jgi:hypothetical protein